MEASRLSVCAGVVGGGGVSASARLASAAGGVLGAGFSSATSLETRILGHFDSLSFFPHYPDTRVLGYTFI